MSRPRPRPTLTGWACVLAVLALIGATSACSGSSGGAGPDNAPEAATCPVDALDDATGTTEVLLWYQLSGKVAETLEAMVDQYNASQSKVHVRAELQGANYDELLRAYERAIDGGEMPDILVAEDTATRFLVDSGTVLPAQSCFDADGLSTEVFLPAAVQHYSVDGVLWPGTVSSSGLLTYYNANHLRRAGLDPASPPGTLDEVRAAAEAIRDAGVSDTPVVLLMDSWLVETQLTGSHQPIVDNDNGHGPGETTEAVFDTDITRTVFDWVHSMAADGLLLPIPATPGARDHFFAMGSQKASITIETSAAATTIQDVLGGRPPEGVGADLDLSTLDAAAAPVFGVTAPGRPQLGGNGFWITTAGTDAEQAAAWDLLRWWNEVPQQVRWHVEGSYLPFLSAAVDTPEVQAFWRSSLAGRFLEVAYQEVADVDPSFSGALIGPYDAFRRSMRDALAAVALQGADPGAAIAEAVAETDDALTRYNDANF